MFTERIPRISWRLLRLPPRLFYALGLGAVPGSLVLLLATTGRKTGRRHVTPLQYLEEDHLLYLISVRGPQADWFQNILADPRVEVQINSQRFVGLARPVTDPAHIACVIQLRLRRHPRLIGTLLRADGLPEQPTREQLEQYAAGLAMVIIPRPVTP